MTAAEDYNQSTESTALLSANIHNRNPNTSTTSGQQEASQALNPAQSQQQQSTVDDDSGRDEEKPIGMWSGIGIVFNQLIGSGIFSTPALIVLYCGTPMMGMVLWILGGLISISGGMAFVELGLLYPTNGGMMTYLAKAYPRPAHLLAFIFAWTIILFVRPASIAASSIVFADYMLYAVAGGENMENKNPWVYNNKDVISRGIAVIGTIGITALNWWSVKWSLRMSNLITASKIGLLFIVSFTGILVLVGYVTPPAGDEGNGWSRGFEGSSTNLRDYALALNKVFWAYEGWSSLHYVAGEMKKPERNLPMSIGFGISGVSVLYLLANIAFFSVVPIKDAISSGEILGAKFTNAIFGPIGGEIVLPMFISFFVLSTNIIYIYSGSYLITSAHEMGLADWAVSLAPNHVVTRKFSLLLLCSIAIGLLVLLPQGNLFNLLVDMIQYPMWFFYGFTALGCIILERRKKKKNSNGDIDDEAQAFSGGRRRRSSNTSAAGAGTSSSLPVDYLLPESSASSRPPFRTSRLGVILFSATCFFLAMLQFWPPDEKNDKDNKHSPYPFYLVPVLGLTFFAMTTIPWYFSMYRTL
ncbi:hypothetical protein H4219_001777 [Mycoemilia scoparia]|uniref:Amino acid transporter n=1 Tax=Mycoemilia scoparia TaxID=417184 RepID=A0A9W8A8N5_9FUNG|nr:hypothetical protein H4219_001777 [Mycoemilia scoparia]